MKLIYIVNVRMPSERAYGVQIMKMCEAFARRGADVVLIFPRRFNLICGGKDPFLYYDVKRAFKMIELPSLDLIQFNLGKFGFWVSAFAFYFNGFFYLLFKYRDFKYIYTRDFYGAFFLKPLGKKIILETHFLPQKQNFFFKFLLKRNHKIVAITKYMENKFLEYGLRKGRIVVSPDGVDLEKFDIEISKMQAREKLNLPLNKKLVVYIGHLYKWKGIYTLADASRFLERESEVLVVGGTTTEDLPLFKKYIQENNLEKVKPLGPKEYFLIPYYLKASDVLVLPNSAKEALSRFYTSPLKMFEYMASKRPIVASDLPSIREILNPLTGSGQANAVLVKPDNPETLAQGIKKILSNPDLAQKISEQAFLDVQKYTWQNRAQKILDFLLR